MKNIVIMVLLAVVMTSAVGCKFKKSNEAADALETMKAVTQNIAANIQEPKVLTAEEQAELKALRAVVEANAAAYQAEDLNALAATLHPEAKTGGQAIAAAYKLFQRLDGIEYKIDSCEYIGSGVIDVVQTTTGPKPFQNSTAKLRWVFKKSGEEWRVDGTEMLQISFESEATEVAETEKPAETSKVTEGEKAVSEAELETETVEPVTAETTAPAVEPAKPETTEDVAKTDGDEG